MYLGQKVYVKVIFPSLLILIAKNLFPFLLSIIFLCPILLSATSFDLVRNNILFLGCLYYTMLLSHPEIHFVPAIYG